jgi:hypothetical protein
MSKRNKKIFNILIVVTTVERKGVPADEVPAGAIPSLMETRTSLEMKSQNRDLNAVSWLTQLFHKFNAVSC